MVTLSPAFEHVQTTGRSAYELALKHGFENIDDLAEALPIGARALDVGAGDSTLGLEIAARCPDIQWDNFDFSYHQALPPHANNSPDNLAYVAGDARKLTDMYAADTFDAVFSYWLLPHLSFQDEAPAREVATALFTVIKPGGFISIGPDLEQNGGQPRLSHWPGAFQIQKGPSLTSEAFVECVVQRTKARGLLKLEVELANNVIVPFFGTSRFVQQREGRDVVYDPKTGEYVHPLSLAGARLAGKLAVATSVYLVNPRRNKHSKD